MRLEALGHLGHEIVVEACVQWCYQWRQFEREGHMCASQGINARDCLNSFNGLGEALMIDIVKINWLLCRLWVNGFDRQINLWQEYKVIARRRLIVDSRVKLDKSHYPWSIELQTKNVGA